jgi:hypothetical protein
MQVHISATMVSLAWSTLLLCWGFELVMCQSFSAELTLTVGRR